MFSFSLDQDDTTRVADALSLAADKRRDLANELRSLGQAGREAYSRLIDEYEREERELRRLADQFGWRGAKAA